jgi:hypothetical protein
LSDLATRVRQHSCCCCLCCCCIEPLLGATHPPAHPATPILLQGEKGGRSAGTWPGQGWTGRAGLGTAKVTSPHRVSVLPCISLVLCSPAAIYLCQICSSATKDRLDGGGEPQLSCPHHRRTPTDREAERGPTPSPRPLVTRPATRPMIRANGPAGGCIAERQSGHGTRRPTGWRSGNGSDQACTGIIMLASSDDRVLL